MPIVFIFSLFAPMPPAGGFVLTAVDSVENIVVMAQLADKNDSVTEVVLDCKGYKKMVLSLPDKEIGPEKMWIWNIPEPSENVVCWILSTGATEDDMLSIGITKESQKAGIEL